MSFQDEILKIDIDTMHRRCRILLKLGPDDLDAITAELHGLTGIASSMRSHKRRRDRAAEATQAEGDPIHGPR